MVQPLVLSTSTLLNLPSEPDHSLWGKPTQYLIEVPAQPSVIYGSPAHETFLFNQGATTTIFAGEGFDVVQLPDPWVRIVSMVTDGNVTTLQVESFGETFEVQLHDVEAIEWNDQANNGISYQMLAPVTSIASDVGLIQPIITSSSGIRSSGGLESVSPDVRFHPAVLVAADLDQDGDTDYIYGDFFNMAGQQQPLTLIENQAGTLVERKLLEVPSTGSLASILVSDLNRDGKLDLVVSDNDENNALGGGPLRTYLQDPTSPLTYRDEYAFPTAVWQPGRSYEVDFNNDGLSDYFIDSTMWDGTLQYQGHDLVTSPSLFLASQNGFADVSGGLPRWNADNSYQNSGVRLFADFDADGDVDGIFLKEINPGGHWFYRNNGLGNLTLSHEINADFGFFSSEETVLVEQAVAADFDGDGNLDFATYTHNQTDTFPRNENQISVFYGDGQGAFAEQVIWTELNPEAGRFPTFLGATDIDGDGLVDLVASAFQEYRDPRIASTHLFLNQGGREFQLDDRSTKLPAGIQLVEVDGQTMFGFSGWHYAGKGLPAGADYFLLGLDAFLASPEVVRNTGDDQTFTARPDVTTFRLALSFGDISLMQQAGSWLLSSSRFGDDTLVGFDRVELDDWSVALDIDGVAGQSYRIYQAAFDRVPDASGLGYWIAQMDQGASLSSIAMGFVQSLEFETRYGSSTSDEQFVDLLYANVLDRQPDQSGYDYWIDVMNKGVSRADVLAYFSESAENVANVQDAIANGIVYVPFGEFG